MAILNPKLSNIKISVAYTFMYNNNKIIASTLSDSKIKRGILYRMYTSLVGALKTLYKSSPCLVSKKNWYGALEYFSNISFLLSYIILPLVKAFRYSVNKPNIDLSRVKIISNANEATISSLKGKALSNCIMAENKAPLFVSNDTPSIELNTGNKAARLKDSKNAMSRLKEIIVKNNSLYELRK